MKQAKHPVLSDGEELLRFFSTKILTKDRYAPVAFSRYSISMHNDYLSARGYVTKKQFLEGVFTRVMDKPVSRSTAVFNYTWEDVVFSKQDLRSSSEPIRWNFAAGMRFSYFKYFFRDLFKEEDVDAGVGDGSTPGRWYEHCVNVPAVNLLYLLTWDVLMFEEFNAGMMSEDIAALGDTKRITLVSDSNVHLWLKGCSFEHSFFKNGTFYASLIGIGAHRDRPAAIYDYRSSGKLSVAKESDGKKQEGESFFLGKMYLDLENGDLLRGELIELLTVMITNGKGKLIPMQKRRLVNLQKL